MEFDKNGRIILPGKSRRKTKDKITFSEKIDAREEVAVIKKQENEILPMVNDKCKKCGNEKAYFWTVQTRASDESETKFFKCTKCSHTHRDYS